MKHNFPEWIHPAEAAIIDGLITAILNRGLTISVYDGEDYALKRSADRELIQKETAATYNTTYLLRTTDGVRVGFFWLVHGNHCDVIFDYSDGPTFDAIWNEIEPLVEKWEASA
jgi:hypothetical protein